MHTLTGHTAPEGVDPPSGLVCKLTVQMPFAQICNKMPLPTIRDAEFVLKWAYDA